MKTKGDISQPTAHSLQPAFTLIELLVVVGIIVLVLGALLPTLGGFFSGARAPNARNLISAHLAGARNYAVANSVTTALVFSEDEEAPKTKRRILMYLAKYDAVDDDFKEVTGRKTTYLPTNILISEDEDENDDDDLEATVVICFSPAGQLIVGKQFEIENPPIGDEIYSEDGINSRAFFWLYDKKLSDEPMDLQINYYTGEVIE